LFLQFCITTNHQFAPKAKKQTSTGSIPIGFTLRFIAKSTKSIFKTKLNIQIAPKKNYKSNKQNQSDLDLNRTKKSVPQKIHTTTKINKEFSQEKA
jgi:hypothetical protein